MSRPRRRTEAAVDRAAGEGPPPRWLERATLRYRHGIYPSDQAVPLDPDEANRRARRDWSRLDPERRGRAWADDDGLAVHLERTAGRGPPPPRSEPPT